MAKFLFLFITGAIGYGFLELLWRGHTHWTMFVLGGICFCILFKAFSKLRNTPLILKAIIGGVIITTAEFVTGCIINLYLKWNVWNYSESPFNFLGQICLFYFLLWTILSIPLVFLCKLFEKFIG